MADKYLIGIDLGTSATKGVLINDQGTVLHSAFREYDLHTPSPDICEVHPDIYWNNTQSIIKELSEKFENESIVGISFSSQAETLICVDSDGIPLRNAIVWLDNRSGIEAKEIENHFGRESIFQTTGQPEVVPTWPATKIAWLRKNEHQIFQKIHKFLMVEDYIIFKLTGRFVTEPSVCSSTLYLDIHSKKWWPQMLDYLQISEHHLPEIVPSGTAIETNQKSTTNNQQPKIIAGAYDHAAGAIGAGNISAGQVTETTGSSMAMVVTTNQPVLDISLNLPCQIHPIEGLYFLLPYGQTAGMALKWFKEVFGTDEIVQAIENNTNVYDHLTRLAEKIPPGSEGLIMLPHLAGAGSPEFNNNCRGVYAGIALHMGKGHFVRALLESVAAMITKNIESVKKSGIEIKEIRALGGGAKSDLWNQIKADMSGIPIRTIDLDEAPAFGAALIAGVGSSVFSNFEEASNKAVKTNKTYTPNPKNNYNTTFEKYNSLYDALKGWW
ncbi:MAG: FGGY family carbohydrate kinase [Bacteroidota bacterium]|nr:FGGY family carbohydrate kinase [Bacteroidota bacterium]